jgi:uncharacterized protein
VVNTYPKFRLSFLACSGVLLLTAALQGCVPDEMVKGSGPMMGYQAQAAGPALSGEIGKASALRAGPGPEHATVGQLAVGTRVYIAETKGTWYRVQPQGGEQGGWVAHDSVRVAIAPGREVQARANAHVNLRSGPSTGQGRVAVLEPGTSISLIEARDGWYRANTPHGSGWVHGSYVTIDSLPSIGPVAGVGGGAPGAGARNLNSQATIPIAFGSPAQPAPTFGLQANAAPVQAGRQNVAYAGYSRDVQPVKALIRQGRIDAASDLYRQMGESKTNNDPLAAAPGSTFADTSLEQPGTENALAFRDPLLSALEQGTLALDSGNVQHALEQYTVAEDILEGRRSGSIAGGVLRGLRNFLVENVSGREEFKNYNAEGFEKVLMLNYKTIGFLLEGQREAYNVSRRASDWQELERQAFEKRIEKARGDQREAGGDAGAGRDSFNSAESLLQEAYADGRAKAAEVPSAYVNPFGYYVVGMVNEFESYSDPSLRDNARIAYQKALELNPSSEVLRQSLAAAEKRGSTSGRVVHVVAGLGFAPEKKTLTYGLPVTQHVIPVKIPVYHRTASNVGRVEVHMPGGRRLATLSPLADVEAIALRHQEDSKPLEVLRVGVTVVRSGLEKQALQRIQFAGIGQLLSELRDATTSPDMRSWQTLPANLQAARLELPANVSKLELHSFDGNGRLLARTTVDLPPGQHGFVYARGIDDTLVAHASPIRWLQ